MNAKIVIASTLKPVIDPRGYEKIGKSLANTCDYEIKIIGSYPTTDQTAPGITLFPFTYNRSNFIQRLILPWKIFNSLSKIKPDILIVSTHELLVIGIFYKLIYRKKIIYDICENYYFNLLYQNNYGWALKQFLAIYVRSKELILSKFIDHFLLAEKCYAKEIGFIAERYTVLENKYKPLDQPLNKLIQNKIEFLLSGTISREYGVFDAIIFFKQFNSTEYRLVMVGHCPNNKTYRQLIEETKNIDNIDISISTQPIPQSEIINKIGAKTIGILPYQINKSTINKIPTKLYEYIGLGIPVLASPNALWAGIIKKHSSGLVIDFNSPVKRNDISVINKLTTRTYTPDLKHIIWYNEENKLIDLIRSLLSTK